MNIKKTTIQAYDRMRNIPAKQHPRTFFYTLLSDNNIKEIDNVIYCLDDLSCNLTIDGLFLRNYKNLVCLSDNIVINGNLILMSCTQFAKLGDNLIVNGYISLQGCPNLDKIPETTQVSDVIITDKPIEDFLYIPEHLKNKIIKKSIKIG
jgi:hypothetical protein